MAEQLLTDTRTGHNGRHSLTAQLRQSGFGRILDRIARLRPQDLAPC